MPVPHPVASDSSETGAVPDASLPSATPVTDAPRASVIVCVYNRARQVLPCLESLLASTFDDFEIVLVDDASTDESPEVLARFRDDHPERSIRIVRNEINQGISGARNAGIDAARGDLVFFTDSDCTVEPDWLQQMVAAFDDAHVSAVAGTVVEPPPRNWAEMARWGGNRINRTRLQGRRLIGCNMAFAVTSLPSIGSIRNSAATVTKMIWHVVCNKATNSSHSFRTRLSLMTIP